MFSFPIITFIDRPNSFVLIVLVQTSLASVAHSNPVKIYRKGKTNKLKTNAHLLTHVYKYGF